MIVTGGVSSYDLIVSQGFPNSDWPTVSSWLPTWDWYAWVILILVLVLIAIVEGSYRFHRDTNEQTPTINLPVVLSVTDYAIGIAGHRGYPDKPTEAYILRLWVVISPASTPIDTLDLLVGSSLPPIQAIDWSGKIETAFNVCFDVSEWRCKGELPVELVAKAGSDTHRSGRKPVDFCMEVFGRHPI